MSFFFIISAEIIGWAFCTDPFLNFGFRLQCYRTHQPGCNREFTDAFPRLAWGYLNLTKADTHFYLFTNTNPEVPELMHKCAGGLPRDTAFNPSCPTEFFIPGFTSGVCSFAIYRELKNERLKSGCYNVILLDWMWGNTPDLKGARENIPIVAKQLRIVVNKLKYRYHVQPNNITLTGHSFGAHIAGLVGQMTRIGKIIGIDPAGVLFSKETPLNERLDAGDADFVQVMHCNGGECLPEYFGVNFTCGTIDFWINGGLHQPSCVRQIPIAFLKADIIYGIFNLYPAACMHFQCLEYYRASMNPTNCQSIGVQCDSYEKFQSGQCRDCGPNGENCAVMGAYTFDCPIRGTEGKSYYLNTKNDCPYCDNSDINLNGFSCSKPGF